MNNFLIIADDLTGATNCASFLVNDTKGIPVFIDSSMLNIKIKTDLLENGTLIMNTNTRTSEKEEIADKIKNVTDFVEKGVNHLIFKKIDTAYRGNVELEIEILSGLLNRKYCFIINSIPSMGRVTIDSYQKIDGMDLKDTEFSANNYEMLKESFLQVASKGHLENRVATIKLDDIRKGTEMLAGIFKRSINNGRNIFVFDSITDDDIDFIYHFILVFFGDNIIGDSLWIGSLGLLGSIKRNFLKINNKKLYLNRKQEYEDCCNTFKNKDMNKLEIMRFMGVTASMHGRSKKQIFTADQSGLMNVINIKITNFIDLEGVNKIKNDNFDQSDLSNFSRTMDFKKAIKKYVDEILLLQKYKNIFILPQVDEALKEKKIQDIILQILGGIISEWQRGSEEKIIKKLILIGGETSFHILKTLGIKKIIIKGQIEAGIDYGIIGDGYMKEMEIIIKGGSVGDDDAVLKMINHN